MKKLCWSLVLMLFGGGAFAQAENPFVNGQSQTSASVLGYTPHYVKEMPIEKYTTRGTEYLHAEWRRGTVVVNSLEEPFVHDQIRLDLMHDQVEFHWGEEGLKVMEGVHFDTLYLNTPQGGNQTFVRTERLNLPGQYRGICEILYAGKFKLVKTYYTKVLPANYNIALMVGRKYDELVLGTDLYVIEGDVAYKLPKKKREILKLLSNYFPATHKAYKKNKPILREEESLLAFIKLNLESGQ